MKKLLVFFCFFNSITAQTYTWIKGSNLNNDPGSYGTQGVTSISNNPSAREAVVSWRNNSNKLWLFGGKNQVDFLNDLWSYDLSTHQWTWLKGSSSAGQPAVYGIQGVPNAFNDPGARFCPSNWADTSGNLWLYGGTYVGERDDLWKYNAGTNEWTWIKGSNTHYLFYQPGLYGTQGVSSPANNPGPRSESMSWTDTAGNFWLFGGHFGLNGSYYYNDLWKYEPSNNEWTWMNGNNTVNQPGIYGVHGAPSTTCNPGARTRAVNWVDHAGNFWLFGGWGYDSNGNFSRLNDLWKYTISTNMWSWESGSSITEQFGIYGIKGISAPSNVPGARLAATGWIDIAGNLILFGGYNYNLAIPNTSDIFNDVWKYTIPTGQWTWIGGSNSSNQTGSYGTLGSSSPNNVIGSRFGTISWTDADKTWIFGGIGYASSGNYHMLNDLWALDDISIGTGLSDTKQPSHQDYIYPNPNSGEFIIKSHLTSKQLQFILFTGSGQKVYEQTIDQNQVRIKTDLSKGFYYYKLLQKNVIIQQGKIIIE